MNDDIQSNFLTTTPSFLNGMATVMNLGGSSFEYNISTTPDEADFIALRNDSKMIGKDIITTIQTVKTEE